ncbi:NAD(P)H-dependent oxidoreductase, partial [Arenibacter sp. F20364]
WVDEHQQIGIDFSSRFVNAFQRLFDKGYENVNGMWTSIGWNSKNPEINYGTGGLLHGKQYILTSSWNAPHGAFTLPNEFFKEISVDNDPLSGFHGMNRYLGMKLHTSIQFHDVEKNSDIPKELSNYEQFLKTVL